MSAIDIEKLTRDYGNGKGIFAVSFQVCLLYTSGASDE